MNSDLSNQRSGGAPVQRAVPRLADINTFDSRAIISADAASQVAAGTNDYYTLVTLGGESVWLPHDSLPGVIQALDDAATAQGAIDDHVADTSGAHAASAISVTPTGLIVATDVQAALAEIDSEKIEKGLLTTRGDLIRRGASAPERVALGAARSLLTSDGTDAVWQSAPFQVVSKGTARYGGGIGTTSFVVWHGGLLYYTSVGSVNAAFWINPADWGPNGVQLRLRAWCITEAAPTASNLDVSVVSVDATSGGTITAATSIIAAASMGVTATANTRFSAVSSPDVTLSTAGLYVPWFTHNVDPAQAVTYGYTLLGRAA